MVAGLIDIPTNAVLGSLSPTFLSAFIVIRTLIIAIGTVERWYLNAIWTCICVIAEGLEHFFIYLLSFFIYSLESQLFDSLVHKFEKKNFHSIYSDHSFPSHNFSKILSISPPTQLHSLPLSLQKTKQTNLKHILK